MALASLVLVYQGPKSLDFQGPPLPMPLVMDVTRLKTITYRATQTTGRLIVVKDFLPFYCFYFFHLSQYF